VTRLSSREEWDVELRPHWTPLFAYGAAFLIAAAHIAIGLLLKIRSSGVIFQTADQVAMAILGLVIAGLVLLFARPRLRVRPAFRSETCWETGWFHGRRWSMCRFRLAAAGRVSTYPMTSTSR
jgi:hypothetical protein